MKKPKKTKAEANPPPELFIVETRARAMRSLELSCALTYSARFSGASLPPVQIAIAYRKRRAAEQSAREGRAKYSTNLRFIVRRYVLA